MADLRRLGNIATLLETLAGVTPIEPLRLEKTDEAKLQRISNALSALDLGPTALSGLSDVADSLDPATDEVLKWDGTEWTSGVVSSGGGAASNLDDLSDVEAPSPSSGQVVAWNATNSRYENADQSAGATALDDLNDVDSSAAGDDKFLRYDGSTVVAETVTIATALSDLNNVSSASPSSGQVLTYNNTNSEWEPAAASGGSIEPAKFGTLWRAVGTQTGYSADGAVQTFTLPADTINVTAGDTFEQYIHMRLGGRGGSGGGGGQTIGIRLPGLTGADSQEGVAFGRQLDNSGFDWDWDVWLFISDSTASPPEMKLSFTLIGHEDPVLDGEQGHDEGAVGAWVTANLTNIDFSSDGDIGFVIRNYSSGGGWLSFAHYEVGQTGVFDGT